MPTTTIVGRRIHIDAEGYLTDYGEWNDELARCLAAAIGIQLTEEHLAVLHFLRHDYVLLGETPTLRRVAMVGGFPVRRLFVLFPTKPSRKMAYVAGLPKPRGCV